MPNGSLKFVFPSFTLSPPDFSTKDSSSFQFSLRAARGFFAAARRAGQLLARLFIESIASANEYSLVNLAARVRRRVRLQRLSEDEDVPVRIPNHELHLSVLRLPRNNTFTGRAL